MNGPGDIATKQVGIQTKYKMQLKIAVDQNI